MNMLKSIKRTNGNFMALFDYFPTIPIPTALLELFTKKTTLSGQGGTKPADTTQIDSSLVDKGGSVSETIPTESQDKVNQLKDFCFSNQLELWFAVLYDFEIDNKQMPFLIQNGSAVQQLLQVACKDAIYIPVYALKLYSVEHLACIFTAPEKFIQVVKVYERLGYKDAWRILARFTVEDLEDILSHQNARVQQGNKDEVNQLLQQADRYDPAINGLIQSAMTRRSNHDLCSSLGLFASKVPNFQDPGSKKIVNIPVTLDGELFDITTLATLPTDAKGRRSWQGKTFFLSEVKPAPGIQHEIDVLQMDAVLGIFPK